MKHLFLIHSPITFLVAVSVIKQLEIANADAIIVFQEFEKIPCESDYVSVSINEFFQKKDVTGKLINFIKHFNIPKRIDYFIQHITGDQQFIVYLPVLTYIGKSFITNANCAGFNFIEEGLLNYYKEETLNGITVINSKDSWRRNGFSNFLREAYILLRGYNFKLQALPFSYSCYSGVKTVQYFGVTTEAFPLVTNNKKVVPFDKNVFVNIRQHTSTDLNNRFIWIGDPGVIQHGFSEEFYLKGIEEGCINFLKKNKVSDALLKFHRDEPAALRQNVIALFTRNNIATSVIPDSTVMELLLLNANNVSLIGIYSSLLYYSSLMGHAAYSIYDYVRTEYARVLKGREMGFYWQQVQPISEELLLVKE